MMKLLNSKLLITLALMIFIVCVDISATVGSAEENDQPALPQTVQFTVRHNVRDIDADSYTLMDSETREITAETASSIKIADIISERKIFAGFAFEQIKTTVTFGDTSSAVTSDTVDVNPINDDHAVIDLYYDRPSYPYVISYVFDDGSGNAVELKRFLPDAAFQPLGKTVGASAPDELVKDAGDETQTVYKLIGLANKNITIAPEPELIDVSGNIDPNMVKNNVITFYYAPEGTELDGYDPEAASETEEAADNEASEAETGKLIIKQSGGSEKESFLYKITSDDGSMLTVSVKGGGSTAILVPLGSYTVKEISGWSWRYDTSEAQTAMIGNPDEIAYVTFSDIANGKTWLGGEGGMNIRY